MATTASLCWRGGWQNAPRADGLHWDATALSALAMAEHGLGHSERACRRASCRARRTARSGLPGRLLVIRASATSSRSPRVTSLATPNVHAGVRVLARCSATMPTCRSTLNGGRGCLGLKQNRLDLDITGAGRADHSEDIALACAEYRGAH